MCKKVGGAVQLRESALDPKKFAARISQLVANDYEELRSMQKSITRYKQRHQPKAFTSLVCEYAGIPVV